MKRKILAGLLSLCMMVSLVPTAVFAEEVTPVVCAGVAETECLAEEHIEGCDKYVAPKATEEPAPAETPAEAVVCTASVECEAEEHTEECYWYGFDPSIPCTKTEGCEMPEKHLGECSVAAGYEAAPVADVVYVAENADTGVKYTTLSEAISNAEDGQTVKLLGNITTSSTMQINKSITIDGDNYTIGGTASPLVQLNSAANITIKNATLSTTGNIVRWAYVAKGYTHSYLNCKISGGVYAIHYDGGEGNVVIEKCTLDGFNAFGDQLTLVTIKETRFEANTSNYAGVNLWGNAVIDNVTLVDKEDGKYVWLDALKFAEITNSQAIVSGVTQSINDYVEANNGGFAIIDPIKDEEGKYIGGTVVGTVPENVVADGFIIGADGTVAVLDANNITSEAELLAALAAGATRIVLGANIELTNDIRIKNGMDVTIEGNGKTITGATGKDVFYVEGGKLTLAEGLNVHAPTDCAIYIRGGDVFTAANLTKAGEKYSVIQGNGNYVGNVTITGGIVKSTNPENTAIYWPQNGKLTIKGGEITGYSAVYIASGSLEITGGTLHGTGDGEYAGVNGGSTKSPGDALVVEAVGGDSGYELISAIYITGGTFISDKDNAVGSYANTTANPDAVALKGFITGGTFSSDPTTFVATGYEVKEDGDKYVVGRHQLEQVAEKAATCTAKGTKVHYKCAFCGELYSDAEGKTEVTAESLVIPATGHSFGSWKTTKGATCARAGEETRTCACGAAEVRTTAKSSMHGYGADGKCATCGATDPNYVAPVATPAPTAAPTAKPTTAPTATPAPEATPEATPAPEMPKEADTTITEVVAKEEVVEAVKETVTVTEGTATVETETVEAVIEVTEEDAPVVLPLAQVTEETAEVVNKAEVATEALETVAEAEKDVVIELTDVTVMLDAEAVKAITEQADGATIEIRAVKTEKHTLTEKQQATLADKDTAIVVTAQIFSDGEYIGDFKGGKATIMLPFQPEEGRAAEDYAVYFIDDHGELVPVPAEYVDGYMVFTTVHFSDYVIVYEGEAFGGSTEIVVPETPAAESSFPVLPVAIVIAIIIIGGVIILMKKKNAAE